MDREQFLAEAIEFRARLIKRGALDVSIEGFKGHIFDNGEYFNAPISFDMHDELKSPALAYIYDKNQKIPLLSFYDRDGLSITRPNPKGYLYMTGQTDESIAEWVLNNFAKIQQVVISQIISMVGGKTTMFQLTPLCSDSGFQYSKIMLGEKKVLGRVFFPEYPAHVDTYYIQIGEQEPLTFKQPKRLYHLRDRELDHLHGEMLEAINKFIFKPDYRSKKQRLVI